MAAKGYALSYYVLKTDTTPCNRERKLIKIFSKKRMICHTKLQIKLCLVNLYGRLGIIQKRFCTVGVDGSICMCSFVQSNVN